MENTLTYIAQRHYFQMLMRSGFSSYNPRQDEEILTLNGVAHYFAKTLEQHDLLVGKDVMHHVSDVAAVVNGKVVLQSLITLTFNDEASALLFKLSHEGASA